MHGIFTKLMIGSEYYLQGVLSLGKVKTNVLSNIIFKYVCMNMLFF